MERTEQRHGRSKFIQVYFPWTEKHAPPPLHLMSVSGAAVFVKGI